MLVVLLEKVKILTYVEDYSCYRIAVWYAMYAFILVLYFWNGGKTMTEVERVGEWEDELLYRQDFIYLPKLRKAKPFGCLLLHDSDTDQLLRRQLSTWTILLQSRKTSR